MLIASSTLEKAITEITGPKISSRAIRNAFDVGDVVHDDRRALSATFEGDSFQVGVRGIFEKEEADFGRAGEADTIDVLVAPDLLTRGFAEARHDLQNAIGQASLSRQRRNSNCGQRGLLGWLDDDRVAAGKHWRNIPHRHEQREVPRQNRIDDGGRLSHDHRDHVGRG